MAGYGGPPKQLTEQEMGEWGKYTAHPPICKQKELTMRKKLIERRVELGLNTNEVAKLCGVAHSTINMWESGKTSQLRQKSIDQISAGLDIPRKVVEAEAICPKESPYYEVQEYVRKLKDKNRTMVRPDPDESNVGEFTHDTCVCNTLKKIKPEVIFELVQKGDLGVTEACELLSVITGQRN